MLTLIFYLTTKLQSLHFLFYELYPHKVLLEQHYEHNNTQILT